MALPLPYTEYLYMAQAEEFGVVLRTSDVAFVSRKLKEAISALDDPDISLTIVPSPSNEGDVWIIRSEFLEINEPGTRGRPRKELEE